MPQPAKIDPAPPPRRYLVEDLPRLRAALIESGGNITHAAVSVGVSKPYMMNLIRRFGLNEWARGLRRARGASDTGRPRDAA